MTKIKAIIIDDEVHCAETLAWQLKHQCPDIHLLAECHSAEDGIRAIQNLNPDLVFLDVEMPKMNGFQLLKTLKKLNFQVVFTTAYDQFALQAFKVSATDYLIKPIDDQELKSAVAKVQKQQSAETNQGLHFLLEQLVEKKQTDRLFVPTLNGLEFIHKNEVTRCESDSNYTTIFLQNDKKMVVSKTLKEFEELLPEIQFFRVHHSHIVNLDYVQKYVKGDGGHLVMKKGEIIPVSRARKSALLEHLTQ